VKSTPVRRRLLGVTAGFDILLEDKNHERIEMSLYITDKVREAQSKLCQPGKWIEVGNPGISMNWDEIERIICGQNTSLVAADDELGCRDQSHCEVLEEQQNAYKAVQFAQWREQFDRRMDAKIARNAALSPSGYTPNCRKYGAAMARPAASTTVPGIPINKSVGVQTRLSQLSAVYEYDAPTDSVGFEDGDVTEMN